MTDPIHIPSHPVTPAPAMTVAHLASLVAVDPSSPSSPSSAPARCSSSSSFPFQRLDAYQAARSLAALVHRAGIADAELRDQATRAAKSVVLNLAEGLPDDRPAMRRKYFACADGSLHETAAALDLAAAIGALGEPEAAELLALALRLRAMLRGLMRRAATARGA